MDWMHESLKGLLYRRMNTALQLDEFPNPAPGAGKWSGEVSSCGRIG
jgi:hypothetical protein